MPGKKAIVIAVVVIGLVVFAAMNMREPETEIKDIDSVEISGGKVHFTLVIEVDNPNMVGAKLVKVDTKVYIDNQYIGPAVSEKEFTIEGGGKSEIEVKFTLDHVGGGNTIRVKGTATVNVFGIKDFEKDIDREEHIV